MAFPFWRDRIQHPGSIISPIAIFPTWHIAWGDGDRFPSGALWQDPRLAIYSNRPLKPTEPLPFALSPTQRFVAMGDLWLTQTAALWQKLGRVPPPEADFLVLVAALWEEWETETLNLLVGMFGLAVWDRDRQVLSLCRDRSGHRTLYYTTAGATRWIAPQLRSLNPYLTFPVICSFESTCTGS